MQGTGYVLGHEGENVVFTKASLDGFGFVNNVNEA